MISLLLQKKKKMFYNETLHLYADLIRRIVPSNLLRSSLNHIEIVINKTSFSHENVQIFKVFGFIILLAQSI